MIALLLLLACRAAEADPHMGERFVEGLEQPPNIADGWRCDVWRGIMDRPQGVACFAADGPPDNIDGPWYPLVYGPAWEPPGLAYGWDCAEWHLTDSFYVSGCFPVKPR